MKYTTGKVCCKCGESFQYEYDSNVMSIPPDKVLCYKCNRPATKTVIKKEIKNHKTIYIMATGPSINDITKGQWGFLKTQTTLGISWFIKKNWETTYYFSLEQHNEFHQVKEIIKHLRVNCWNTKLFINGAAKNWIVTRIDHEFVDIGDWLDESWNWAKTLDDKLCVFRGTLTGAINLSTVLGAKKIVLCGVDMNDETHFYKDVPEPSTYMEKIKIECGYDPDKDGHSTNLVYENIKGICELLKFLSNRIDIKCASKDSYLVKNGIFEYEEIPSA